ncbi:MAG TPA: hypothetical protein ENK11_03090 [Phycisphaerales bacterium]|nr:hypothetical protein [Phycisphaerales bacterium]
MSDHGGQHDDWFRHSPEEGLPQHEHAGHVNTTSIGLTLLVIVFGVLGLVILLSMYYVSYTTTLKAERQEGTRSAAEYLAYRDSAERALSSFGWADRNAGKVNLPIDRAMDDVVAYYNRPGRSARAPWHGPARAPAAPTAAADSGTADGAGPIAMEAARSDD